MEHSVVVRLLRGRPRPYTIRIAAGLLDALPERIAAEYPGRNTWVITDGTVARLHGRRLLRNLVLAGVDAALVEIPPGEEAKSAAVAAAVHTQLLTHGVDRASVIIACGGGVVGDLAGFIAATLLRGIDWIQVPTTLLAQVDSSVGGKVGVNHPLGKNLIGAFHQPSAVFVDPAVLASLPPAELRNGFAEIIKIAAAIDPVLFRRLERRSSPWSCNIEEMVPLIARAVGLKAAVVARDEREASLRKVLNLGHTIGHAIEAASAYRIRHGEAVAIGLAAEGRIAHHMGLLAARDLERLTRVLRSAALPTRLPRRVSNARIARALLLDKKSEGGRPRFVLLRRIGETVLGADVPPDVLRAVLGAPA